MESGEDEKPPLFREIAETWIDRKWPTLRPKTQECYEKPLERAVDEYGDMQLEDITAADIEALLLRMKAQGYSGQTIKDQKSVLNQIFNHAIAHDPPYIRYNPCTAITLPRGLPKTALTPETEKKIISVVDEDPFNLFPYLLLFTGLRRGEALGLRWGATTKITKSRYRHNISSSVEAVMYPPRKPTQVSALSP